MADNLNTRIKKLETVKRKKSKLTWKEFVDLASRDNLPAEFQNEWEEFIKEIDNDRQTENQN